MSVKQLQVWLKAFYESFWGEGLFTLREAKRYDGNAKEWKKGIEVSCIDIDKYENGRLFYPEGWFPPPHEGSAMALQPLLEWLQAFYSSLLPQALFEIEESMRYYDGPWPHGEDRKRLGREAIPPRWALGRENSFTQKGGFPQQSHRESN